MRFYKYTPALLEAKTLEDTLVGRDVELDNLKRILRSASSGKSFSHAILIGPKGIGKTHLLRILYYAVKGEIKTKGLNIYKKKFIPVIFSEEEYPGDITKFIKLALEYLAESGSEEISPIPRELISPVTLNVSHKETALSYLKTFREKTGKTLLLLVDNLNDIIERFTDEDQSSLREILMTYDSILLIGSASTLFDSIINHDRPLYNFFEIIWLKDLPIEETVTLLKRYAELEGRSDLIQKFKDSEPKLRAIHELAGGNPRLILSLYYIIVEGDITSVESIFLKILDELSPNFRERMKDLSDQQSEIIDIIAKAETLLTPTEISARCHIPVNVVNSQLKRLETIGYVKKSAKSLRKRVFYDLNEKLFRLWRQMRVEAGRKRLGFIVRFLEIWFTKKELFIQFEKLMTEFQQYLNQGDFDKMELHLNKLWYITEAIPEVKEKASKLFAEYESVKKIKNKLWNTLKETFKLEPDEHQTFADFYWLTFITFFSIMRGETNLAKNSFEKALAFVSETDNRSKVFSFLSIILRVAVQVRQIQVLKFFLQELHARKQQELLEFLSPYSTLIKYLESKDPEIIERLHEEERIIIEDMLRMLEDKTEGKSSKRKKPIRKLKERNLY